jgi:hypothetical protein
MSPDRIELSGDIPARWPKRRADVVVTEISRLDTKLPILSLGLIASRFQSGFQRRAPWTTSNRRQKLAAGRAISSPEAQSVG